MWNEAQLAYLAGIIDADGTINIYRSGKRPRKDYNVRFYVVNTNKTLIDWLQSNFGGMVYSRQPKNPAWKIKYEWVIERRVFDLIAKAILPYVVAKQKQLKLALRFRESFQTRYRVLPSDVRIFREQCFHQMKSLNLRGSKGRAP